MKLFWLVGIGVFASVGVSVAATSAEVGPRPTVADVVTPAARVVKDSPLFVSASYPTEATPGSTVRFTVVCSRPIADGDNPGLWVTAVVPGVEGFTALSGDLTRDGVGYFIDWTVPADQPVGEYTLVANCDGPSDAFDPGDYPAGISSGVLPFRLAAIPVATVPSTIPAAIPATL